MIKLKKRISNPMTIIAIFAALSETSAAVSLPFLDNDERELYVWFLISFPFYLLFLFFLTLNFNYRSLYAPSDFDKEKNFIKGIDQAERSENKKHPRPEGSSTKNRDAATPPPDPPSAIRLARAGTLRYCFSKALGPPSAISLRTSLQLRHDVLLPVPLSDLCIVDARWIGHKGDLTSLMEKTCETKGKPGQVVVFLACDMSEKLLKEQACKPTKQTRKAACAAFCIVYNLNSNEVRVLNQTL